MPTVLTPSHRGEPFGSTPHRRRWTRKECQWLEDNGVLSGRYELIEGEIIEKMSQNRPHSITVMRLIRWAMEVFGEEYIQCQMPIDLVGPEAQYNEPEPDIAVTAQPIDTYADHNPEPIDLVLVIEVADTTLSFDLHNKALLYARNGIPEYWVADVNGRQMIVHREPTTEGYGSVVAYQAEEEVSSLAHPEVSRRVESLIPALVP